MNWRLKSLTYGFNIFLLGVSLIDTPFINKFLNSEAKNLIRLVAVTNLGLREKTQRKI